MTTTQATTVQTHCTDRHDPVPVTVSCEPTTIPGLVITPGVRIDQDGRARFVGSFHLVHQLSGQLVVPTDLPPRYLHRMAEELGATGIDWTQPHEAILDPARVVDVRQLVWGAVCIAREAFLDDCDEPVEAN
jgi:hypothetical protein